MLDEGKPVQVIDARPGTLSRALKTSSRVPCGAIPNVSSEWVGELSKSEPVVMFCAYGFHVGCNTAVSLREAGFDASYIKGGHSAWKAIGGRTKMYP